MEEDRLFPSNPYAASKAAAEMLVLSYNRTYGIDYVITRSTNNYGPRQYNEKLIPKALYYITNNKKIPVHGDGSYQRDWLYVEDNVDAIFTIINKKIINDIINIGANNHFTNLDVVKNLLQWCNNNSEDLIAFVENRWGQDKRYAVDCTKMKQLGWKPKHEKGLYKWF